MPVIKVETPNGVQQVNIAGNTPTEEEIAAMKKQFGIGKSTQPTQTTQTVKTKDPTNALGAFASGFDDPTGLKGLKDKIVKKIDKAKNAYDDGDEIAKDKKGNTDSTTRSGLNMLKQELGFDNPQLIITGLNKIQQGRVPSKNELSELAPVLQAVRTALDDPQGRNKLRALLKSIR